MMSSEITDGKDKNHMISLMWDIKQKATNKQTHIHRQYGGYHRGREGKEE